MTYFLLYLTANYAVFSGAAFLATMDPVARDFSEGVVEKWGTKGRAVTAMVIGAGLLTIPVGTYSIIKERL